MNQLLHERTLYYNLGRTDDHHLEKFVCYSVSPLPRNSFTEPLPSTGLFYVYSLQREHLFGEPLASNGLPLLLHYSVFQALLSEPLPSSGHIRHNVIIINIIMKVNF
jgi:hypothetical protein